MAKTTPLFRLLGKLLVGPAAGAFGFWLLSEAPMIHAAMCVPGA